MKTIELSNGLLAQVDDEDYERLIKTRWYSIKGSTKVYARSIDGYMHRVVMNAVHICEIDHIDGNGLNNQKSNLRHASKSDNKLNRGIPRNNSSGYKGVHFCRITGKWRAELKVNGKRYRLGRYDTPKDAGMAYNDAVKRYCPNFGQSNDES